MQKNYSNYNRLNTELEQSNCDDTYNPQSQNTRTSLFKLEQSNFEGPSEIDFSEHNSRVNLLRSNVEQINVDDPVDLNFCEQNSKTDLFLDHAEGSEPNKSESSLEPFPEIDFNRQESYEQGSFFIKDETQLENSTLISKSLAPDVLQAIFKDMIKYKPKDIELETFFKPFIPDYIPHVVPPEYFLGPNRPDGKSGTLSIWKLNEPKFPGKDLSDNKSKQQQQDGSDLKKEIPYIFNEYIAKYKPKNLELDTKLKAFIPDYIPAIGSPNDFLEPKRPEGDTTVIGFSVIAGKKRLVI